VITDAAFDLIVISEVTSRSLYEKLYMHPTRPGGSSGITVGIGYDCGYAKPDGIARDWDGLIPPPMIQALQRVSGLRGAPAQRALFAVRREVSIPWESALRVFRDVSIPMVERECSRLPNWEHLPPDCQGALVSLAYNRGYTFRVGDDRHLEMRRIYDHLAKGDFGKIPGEFRSMRRLWTDSDVRGVAVRREAEARLFEKGLQDS
jgi:hypothetical protein